MHLDDLQKILLPPFLENTTSSLGTTCSLEIWPNTQTQVVSTNYLQSSLQEHLGELNLLDRV